MWCNSMNAFSSCMTLRFRGFGAPLRTTIFCWITFGATINNDNHAEPVLTNVAPANMSRMVSSPKKHLATSSMWTALCDWHSLKTSEGKVASNVALRYLDATYFKLPSALSHPLLFPTKPKPYA